MNIPSIRLPGMSNRFLFRKTIFFVLLVPFFLLYAPSTGFTQAGLSAGSLSVVQREPEIRELIAGFNKKYADLIGYADNRYSYFSRGLGWQQQGDYGFSTGKDALYFSDEIVQITTYSDNPGSAARFTMQYQDNVLWAVYEDPSGAAVSIGTGSVRQIEWLFEDGMRIFLWGNSVQITYGSEELTATLHYVRGEPVYTLSDGLSDILFGPSGNTRIIRSETAPEHYLRLTRDGLLDTVIQDFSTLYFARILAAAEEERVDFQDPDAMALFATNWFRTRAGLPEATHNRLLEKAADSHAQYIITNKVVNRMLSWDVDTVDLDLFLELHNETAGTPGYTGFTVQDRTTHSGYGSASGECVAYSQQNVLQETIGWFHTIFHRRPYLDPRVVHHAQAHRESDRRPDETVGVANFGYDFEKNTPEPVLYPADGEELVPFAWSGLESPDPFPGEKKGTGVPLTVSYVSETYRGGRLRLTGENGKAVPLKVSGIAPDADHFLEAVPVGALTPDTWYTLEFTTGGTSFTSRFRTAPFTPAELFLRKMSTEMPADLSFPSKDFNLAGAVLEGKKKGELQQEVRPGKTLIEDRKYGFQIETPSGWITGTRDWQEVLLEKEWRTIHLFLYPKAPEDNPESVRRNLEPQLKMVPIRSREVSSPAAFGYRTEYEWEYDGKAIVYYLVFGDFALAIYGYGVTPEEIDSVFESFSSTGNL